MMCRVEGRKAARGSGNGTSEGTRWDDFEFVGKRAVKNIYQTIQVLMSCRASLEVEKLFKKPIRLRCVGNLSLLGELFVPR